MSRTNAVLYYPTIEFQNEAWVKASLLLWDKIYRLVPKGYVPNDSNAVECAVDNDLVRAVNLEHNDLSGISSQFLGFLERLPFRPAGLEAGYTSRLHEDKIDRRLYPLLRQLAINMHDGWLDLPTDIANGYMLYLAKVVSQRRNLATVTDNRDVWTITPYFKERANFDENIYNPEAEGFYTSLIFTDILPANIAAVDMTKIVDFVNKRKDERARLRTVLQDFSEQLQTCASEEHTKTVINDFETNVQQAKEDFKKSTGFLSEFKRTSLLTIGIPVSLSVMSLVGMQDNPYAPANIASSVIMGAVAAYSDYKVRLKQARKDSYASYLVDIDAQLISRRAVPLYHHIFEEFMND